MRIFIPRTHSSAYLLGFLFALSFHLTLFFLFKIVPFTTLSSFVPIEVQANLEKKESHENGLLNELAFIKSSTPRIKNKFSFSPLSIPERSWHVRELEEAEIDYLPYEIAISSPLNFVKDPSPPKKEREKPSNLQEWSLRWKIFLRKDFSHPFFFIPLHDKLDESLEKLGLEILKKLEFTVNSQEAITEGEVEIVIVENKARRDLD